MSYSEKKDKMRAGITTAVVMLLLLIFFHFCGLTYVYPPPPAKKVILIEMTMESGGGGGGGGNTNPRNSKVNVSAENIVRQHDVSLPSLPSSKTNKPSQQVATEDVVPQPDASAMYRPGMGSGKGGGEGTGVGSGVGSGFGTGMGSGSGGGSGSGTGNGIGDGTGNRGYVYMPNLTISEDGKVYVRVLVATDGTVKDAQVISDSKHPTTITSSKIRTECERLAKTAKYKSGKEEYRIIVFSL
jgi:hypothetical protein